jgi:hypothetical protein
VVRNAAEPHDLSEIRGGVRNMGVLRYRTVCMLVPTGSFYFLLNFVAVPDSKLKISDFGSTELPVCEFFSLGWGFPTAGT